MLSQKWDVSRFWDTNPPFNGRRGENGDDGSSDLATDSPELRSSRPRVPAGCIELRPNDTCSKQDAFSCEEKGIVPSQGACSYEEVKRLRNRGPIT